MSDRAKPFSQKYQKQWSETHKYKHIHTGEYCTFESYLAEYLIIRWTESFKMQRPSYKFWTVGDKYHDMFIRNMKAASGLQKKFKENIVIEAIKSDHFKKIYHIGLKAYGPRGWKYNPVALQAIKNYNKEVKDAEKLAKKSKQTNEIVEDKKEVKVRRTQTYSKKKTMLNKLRDL
tara:strand:+ start:1862 stop:2386 length:525 start_codon:yes stop_codon:yes gene_type:complete